MCTIHKQHGSTETHKQQILVSDTCARQYCEALDTAPTGSECSVGGQNLDIVGGVVSQTRQWDRVGGGAHFTGPPATIVDQSLPTSAILYYICLWGVGYVGHCPLDDNTL